MIKMRSVFSANIRKYRTKLRLTQRQAAERAGITANYWSRLELVSQPDCPSIPMIFKIAKALDIKPYRLLKAR